MYIFRERPMILFYSNKQKHIFRYSSFDNYTNNVINTKQTKKFTSLQNYFSTKLSSRQEVHKILSKSRFFLSLFFPIFLKFITEFGVEEWD